mmetsp:Transcript_129713/g.416087  ORF Transcript_129713/g.416087 Transcript_129713/m.416087 type:complete len:749 (+) Transcript_129713:143-2389(+)
MVGGTSKVGVLCAKCAVRHKKVPKSWVLNDAVYYCEKCWADLKCSSCQHHDPKGSDFRGAWQCRACRHRHRTKGAERLQEDCHQIIIDDHNALPSSLVAASLTQERAAPHLFSIAEGPRAGAEEEGGDDGEGEGADALAPLPAHLLHGRRHMPPRQRQRQEAGHIVLVLDASGSMRTCDVDVGAMSRLDAATTCAATFIEQHARLHPLDVFSAAAFAEETRVLCRAASSKEAVEAVQNAVLRGAGGTFFKPALEAAARCLDARPSLPGHIVWLSDGKPADTKVALEYFQQAFVHGNHATTRLHGIGFGDTVDSFAPLQQYVCISSGTFTISGCNLRSLCEAFSSVSSIITSIREGTDASWDALSLPLARDDSAVEDPTAAAAAAAAEDGATTPAPMRTRTARIVDYELPELGDFGKKGVLRFRAARATFVFDGTAFQRQDFETAAVERRTRPYMRGGMRLVYGFRDPQVVANSGGWLVAKMSRFADAPFNTNAMVEAHAKSTAVARFFAGLFNEECREAAAKTNESVPPSLIFVPCFVYNRVDAPIQAADSASEEPEVFAAERYLPGVFLKYNSNNGYVNDAYIRHNETVQAFLHYSYVKSGGALVVADLQGVARDREVLLTDPQVLTAGSPADATFGPGDLGARGARASLAAHRCGHMCRFLDLKPVSAALLRRLEPTTAQRAAAVRRAPSSRASSGSGGWDGIPAETSRAAGPEWERCTEYNLTDLASEPRSSQASASSWVHLLDG